MAKKDLEKSDLQLIAEFRKGNQSSFEELVERYTDKVFSLASRLTRNQEDAEEVIQDVFVTVYRKIAGFEGKSSFSSWLYRVTFNASLMKLRRRKPDRTIPMEEALPQIHDGIAARSAEQTDSDKITLRVQVTEVLEQAISKLPEDYRPVFILRDIDGLTSREVSKILNLTIPAVKSRLHRSRLMLRRRLSSFYNEYKTGNSGNNGNRSVGNL
jgi:RNA polymerase sigma-70 factor (ECF subfamily)